MTSESSEGGAARAASVDAIGEFYTKHPYPPPIDNLDRAREQWNNENILRSEFHLLWPDKEYRADIDVLVAGCGTWQAAKYAICHPGARVVAIDVSPTSLEHTEALKQQYDMTNLETRQLSIENAGELDRRFDLIICTGVLHHLVDPDEGLRALFTFAARHALPFQAVEDIGAHGLPRKQRKMLEDNAAIGAGRRHRPAFHQNAAGFGREESANEVKQGRFPAARRAKQRQKFARAHLKRHVGQCEHGPTPRRAISMVHPLDDDLTLAVHPRLRNCRS